MGKRPTASNLAVARKILNVSRSGYYAWSKRPPSLRTQAGVATTGRTPATRSPENEQLSQQIEQIHQDSRKTYGSPRIHTSLMAKGWQISRQRVVRLMAKLGISVGSKRKFKLTTDSGHNLPVAANVVDRNFATSEPDRAWVADITYIWTTEGWLYLAVILNLFSRRIVGWSMAEHLRSELVLSALEAALGQRIPSPSGLLFHSERGSQYASEDYQVALHNAGISCSMSHRANC
jgi:putative transposase